MWEVFIYQRWESHEFIYVWCDDFLRVFFSEIPSTLTLNQRAFVEFRVISTRQTSFWLLSNDFDARMIFKRFTVAFKWLRQFSSPFRWIFKRFGRFSIDFVHFRTNLSIFKQFSRLSNKFASISLHSLILAIFWFRWRSRKIWKSYSKSKTKIIHFPYTCTSHVPPYRKSIPQWWYRHTYCAKNSILLNTYFGPPSRFQNVSV